MGEAYCLAGTTAHKKESLRSAQAVSEAENLGRPGAKICTALIELASSFLPEIAQRGTAIKDAHHG